MRELQVVTSIDPQLAVEREMIGVLDRRFGASAPALVWYPFTQDRTGADPQAQPARFKGSLQADGYTGYGKLSESGRVAEVAYGRQRPGR